MSSEPLVCPLCGRYLDAHTYAGQCSECEKLTAQLIEDKIFVLPEVLDYLTSRPTQILTQHRIELAAIRAGKITAHKKHFRPDIDIKIAVARESGTTEEKNFIEQTMLPYYKRQIEARDKQTAENLDKEKQLADILARRSR